MPTTVGIREVKAKLSSYVDQVKAGATVTITERGKPVGRIVEPGSEEVERLIARGADRPARKDLDRRGRVASCGGPGANGPPRPVDDPPQ